MADVVEQKTGHGVNPKQTARLAVEIALMGLSIAVMVSLERLFVDTSYLGEVIILVLASHLVSAVMRRLGVGTAISTLVSATSFVLVFTAVLYPDTTRMFLPTGTTLDLLGNNLAHAWAVYTDQSAPVDTTAGFTAVLGLVGWAIAYLSDWAAFRLKSPIETLVPATSVFVFGALMGVDRNGIAHGAVFAAAAAGVLLALRAERQTREETWAAGGSGRGISSTLRIGGASAAIAVLAGVVAGPLLPGARSEPLLDFRNITGSSQSRTVISPLVEISTSLVQQSNFEIFSVAVDKADKDYWRLMALNSFDGSVWRRSSKFDDVRGPVGSDVDNSISRRKVTQTITTRRLGNIYLPAAYEVSAVVDSGGIALEYEQATGALVVKQQDRKAAEAGFTYTIESSVPDFDPADLPADATAGLDPDFVAENTALPAACGENESPATDKCWPTSVGELARQITAGATTDHQRALMLQNYFLDPARFTYDLDVALTENVKDVEDFLFVTRRGYCEQFAATFAGMARSLGIPTRVAVGFTWGDWDEARGEYVVRGRNAHAWPEVYFAGAGWVVFDPTPGRARPFDSDITGLQEAQFGLNDGINRQVSNNTDPVPTTTRPQPASDGNVPDPGSGLANLKPLAANDTTTGGAGTRPRSTNGGGLTLVKLVIATAAALLTVPITRTIRRRRLVNRVAGNPQARSELAFDDAVAALALLGIIHESHETPLEFERRVSRQWPRAIPGVHELMRAVTVLRYGRPADPVMVANDATRAAAEVSAYCRSKIGSTTLAAHYLDPRRVSPVS